MAVSGIPFAGGMVSGLAVGQASWHTSELSQFHLGPLQISGATWCWHTLVVVLPGIYTGEWGFSSHLLSLKCSCHISDHLCKASRSLCRINWSPGSVGFGRFLYHRQRLDLDCWGDQWLTTVGRSSTKHKRRVGPITLPWGIPYNTSVQEEYESFMKTICCQTVKKITFQNLRGPHWNIIIYWLP